MASNGHLQSNSSGYAAARWNTSYGPDCEVYVDIVTADGSDFDLNLRVGGTVGSPTCYQLMIQSGTGYIKYLNSGSPTNLGASFSINYVDGDKVGFSAVGSVLDAWLYHGGSWAIMAERTDTNLTGAGYIAIEDGWNGQVMDNFGGGSR